MPNAVKGFRLDDKIISELKNDSKEKGITLNNHVSNILKKYNDTYRHFEKLRYICTSPELMSELIQNNQNNLEKLIKIYKKDLEMQALCSMGKLTSQNIITLIEKRSFLQGTPFKRKKINGGAIEYVIIHNLGLNWSLMQKKVLETLMKSVNTEITGFDYNNESLCFTIKHNE